ncbi:MAG: hypothetical protein ABI555_08910 [Chloroflexota bacterium]
MTTTPADSPAADRADARSGRTALAGAFLAAIVIGVAWIGLSLATGLLYHLMPGATFGAGAWVFHEAGKRAATRMQAGLVLGFAGLVTAGAAMIIEQAGGVVGPPLETVIVIAAGLAFAVWRLSRA